MHLIDKSVVFLIHTNCCGTVPLAVGAAMASRLKNDRSISVAYLEMEHAKKEWYMNHLIWLN